MVRLDVGLQGRTLVKGGSLGTKLNSATFMQHEDYGFVKENQIMRKNIIMEYILLLLMNQCSNIARLYRAAVKSRQFEIEKAWLADMIAK